MKKMENYKIILFFHTCYCGLEQYNDRVIFITKLAKHTVEWSCVFHGMYLTLKKMIGNKSVSSDFAWA
jgi:hypothetical protein